MVTIASRYIYKHIFVETGRFPSDRLVAYTLVIISPHLLDFKRLLEIRRAQVLVLIASAKKSF